MACASSGSSQLLIISDVQLDASASLMVPELIVRRSKVNVGNFSPNLGILCATQEGA
jgi:hypothetical protein